ncbi:MAG: hypothetical protein ABI559_05205 [Chloroflexota bacterium]
MVRGLIKRRSFYTNALTEEERKRLPAALEVEGLDEEIAVLRVRLFSAMREEADLRLVTHGIDMLVKAVATQYRLSRRARKDLADKITTLLNSLGDQLLPAGQ